MEAYLVMLVTCKMVVDPSTVFSSTYVTSCTSVPGIVATYRVRRE